MLCLPRESAGWIAAAAVELLAGIGTLSHGPQTRLGTALSTNRPARKSFLERIEMLPPCAPGLGEPAGIDRFADLIQFFIHEKDLGFALDVSAVAAIKDIRRHESLELTFAPKHDNRMYFGMLYSEELRKGLSVTVVLE